MCRSGRVKSRILKQLASRQEAEYSDESFWAKLRGLATETGEVVVKGGKKIAKGGKRVVKKVVYTALVLYYCLNDDDTPAWARSIIVGALLYLISPADAVPWSLADDWAVLAAAAAMVAAHISPEHKRAAREKMDLSP